MRGTPAAAGAVHICMYMLCQPLGIPDLHPVPQPRPFTAVRARLEGGRGRWTGKDGMGPSRPRGARFDVQGLMTLPAWGARPASGRVFVSRRLVVYGRDGGRARLCDKPSTVQSAPLLHPAADGGPPPLSSAGFGGATPPSPAAAPLPLSIYLPSPPSPHWPFSRLSVGAAAATTAAARGHGTRGRAGAAGPSRLSAGRRRPRRHRSGRTIYPLLPSTPPATATVPLFFSSFFSFCSCALSDQYFGPQRGGGSLGGRAARCSRPGPRPSWGAQTCAPRGFASQHRQQRWHRALPLHPDGQSR